jgi:hypothetical protein
MCKMDLITRLVLPIFLVLAGLQMCGVALSRPLAIFGGVCGIIAAVLLLIGAVGV